MMGKYCILSYQKNFLKMDVFYYEVKLNQEKAFDFKTIVLNFNNLLFYVYQPFILEYNIIIKSKLKI